ncbi:LysR family transcriptional regulator [Streptosporangium lutulentum]
MQLELRHLRVVCTIADAGTLSRAATTIGVSQPALTAQLQRVEGALGGQLFRRSRLGVTPTPFGQFVLTRARSILLTVDELVTGTGADEGQPDVARIGGYVTPMLSGLLSRLFKVLDVPITVHTEYSPGSSSTCWPPAGWTRRPSSTTRGTNCPSSPRSACTWWPPSRSSFS